MSGDTLENAGDLFAEAARAVEELYCIRDTHFPANPDAKIAELLIQSDVVLKMLDEIPQEKRKTPAERATYEHLRGKTLDVFPEHRKEAEDHLSKAVKLNPSNSDAWLCLGNCIWKKGDLASAKNCFTLGLSKGPNKQLLCHLSMLERTMARGSEDPAKLVDDSIKHAKEAIALDVMDGRSWYSLAISLVTSFFASGAWNRKKLVESLKAYQQAEKDVRMTSNPDLYYNSAIVNRYMENYDRALSGFEAAALKDPSLNASREIDRIVQLLDKIQSSLRVRCLLPSIKVKPPASLASSLASVTLHHPSYVRKNVDDLSNGLNKTIAIVGKVILYLKHDDTAPFYYRLWDSSQTSYILSVYGIKSEAIKEGDQVTTMDPYFQYVDFSWKEKLYEFRSVRVDFLEQVLVNGKPLPPEYSVRTSIYTQIKS